jgi:2-dehydropantoate 2-reductase
MARICVAGVGAVGSTIAARLLAAGHEVRLLARGTRLAQLRTRGLEVNFAGERFTAPVTASDHAEFGVQDIVFTAAKAHGLEALLPQLEPLIGPHTLLVPLVNGIPFWYFHGTHGRFAGDTVAAVDPRGALHDLLRETPSDARGSAGALGAAHLLGCVLYVTARLEPTGEVAVMGGQRLVVGDIDAGAATDAASSAPGAFPPAAAPHAAELAALLSRAGLATTATPRIRDSLWTKVALNLATNPLSVVTGATLVDMFTDPRLLGVVSAVLTETARVAEGHGATATMTLDEMLATGRNAGAFETSMLQDYRAGRPLELGAIASSVLELADKIGEQMPTTRIIVDLCAHRASREYPSP